MPKPPEPPKRLLFVDPNREPVRVVDQVTVHPSKGSHLDITLCAFVSKAIDENECVSEPVVTARLRIDLPLAKALVDGLTKHVAMIEAAKSTKN